VKSKETIVQQIGSEKVLEENIGEIRMRSWIIVSSVQTLKNKFILKF
jgi:hypothetical protein